MKKPLLMNQPEMIRDFSERKRNIDFKLNAKKIFGRNLDFKEAKSRVLIVTSQDDGEINYIGPKLVENDIDYIRLNTEDFTDYMELTIAFNPQAKRKARTELNFYDEKIGFETIDLIWPRHFIEEDLFFHDDLSDLTQRYLSIEWTEMINSVYSLNREKVIVPLSYSINKSQQLVAALESGLDIPRTIITNSYDDLKNFFSDGDEKIFAKALSHHSLYTRDGKSFDFYGRSFSSVDELANENIRMAPVVYQELIDKSQSVEYRVSIFGKQIFSHKYIDIKEDDWHFEDISNVKLVEEELPQKVQDKLRLLFDYLNLVVGTVDIINLHDRWYFLEVNTAGDWRWLEQIAGVDFSDDIVAMINDFVGQGRRDCSEAESI